MRVTIGTMSSNDAAPLPRLGEVFFDVRGDSRSMRLSWYGDTGVAVFSIWQGGRCTGTFRLPVDELPRMMATLRGGPDGSDASHDVSGAHDATRVRDFGGESAARDLAPRGVAPRDLAPRDLAPPRDLPPRDLPPRDLPPRESPGLPADRGELDRPARPRRALEDAVSSYMADPAPEGYPGERTAAFPAPEGYAGERTAAFPAPPALGRPPGRPGTRTRTCPRRAAAAPRTLASTFPRPPACRRTRTWPTIRSGWATGARTRPATATAAAARAAPTSPADDSRTDPGAGDPLSYRAGESRGYAAPDAADYPAGDPLGYRPGDDRDYAAAEGHDYRGGGGRHYAAGEGPGYGAEEGRGYPGDDDRGYAPGDPHVYAADDGPGYRAAEGRHYAADDGAGYRAGEGRHYAAGEPGPEGYWSEPESAAHSYAPAWTGDYGDGAEFPPESGEDPYGYPPRAVRRDRRLAAGDHDPAGIGRPRASDARHARLR